MPKQPDLRLLQRQTQRRGRDNIVPETGGDAYRMGAQFPGGTVCPTCHAVFHDGRWTWDSAAPGAPEAECPACRRIADGYCAGLLHIRGAFVRPHRADLMRLIDAEAAVETAEHPLHRIARTEWDGRDLRVTTADSHLARRLGEALHNAYGGNLELEYPAGEETVTVTWERTDAHLPALPAAPWPWPAEIVDNGVVVTPDASAYIDERLDALSKVFDGIVAVRVTLDSAQAHHRQGGPFWVSIRVEVPGNDIIVNRQPGRDLHVAIRTAFDAAQRQLEEHFRKAREAMPAIPRDERQRGTVVRIGHQEGYGFIEAEDGHEVYFNRNAVLGHRFDALEVGRRVRFSEEAGDEGPQATTVRVDD